MDFNKVEQEALQTETAKNDNENSGNNLSYEEQDKQLNSIKLAYDEKQKMVEKQLKSVPNKAAQIERLGIGFTNTGKSTKSHSAVSDMKVIKQDDANLSKSKDTLSNIDDFTFNSTSKYQDFVKSNDNFWNDMGIVDKKVKKPQIFDTITTIDLDIKNKNKIKSEFSEDNQPNRDLYNKNIKSSLSTSDNSEAQKKFANAKAISSEQYFGGDQSNVILFI